MMFENESHRGIMVKLRPYQIEAIEAIEYTFKQRERQFIEMPTGSGKTVTFLAYAQKNHKKILIIVPSKELLRQVYESALLFFNDSEVSRKGDKYNGKIANIHICIINSARGKHLEGLINKEFDLVIIDEAHHSQSNSYIRLIDTINNADKPLFLGVTATPDRTDGLFIKEILGDCSYKITTSQLINQKFLSDIEGFSVKTNIDITEVDEHNGEFSLNQLYKKLSTKTRNDLIIELCKKEMSGRKCLIFCINIAHSKEIFQLLKESDVSCFHIDGTMRPLTRWTLLEAFRKCRGSAFLCNCNLLIEGFDEPSIDGIILARPTKSRGFFNQMIGRGLRICKGKENCKIIDIVDNHRNLAGFNSIIDFEKFKEIDAFKSISDIENHISNEKEERLNFNLERVELIDALPIFNQTATPSMFEYLKKNKIYFDQDINFEEGCFEIWFNELKKDYKNGHNRSKTHR